MLCSNFERISLTGNDKETDSLESKKQYSASDNVIADMIVTYSGISLIL